MTVSVTSDSKKCKVELRDNTPQTPRKTKRNFPDKNQGKNNEGVLPPTIDSSRRKTEQICGGVEMYNERSLRLKYRSQGVQTLFYESTPSTPDPLGDQIPPGARGNSRHAGTNHPHASEECNNRGASELPRILLKRIPGTQSFRRMASSYSFKKSESPHSCTSFSYVHYKLSSEFCLKRRLRVQNRSAGCVLSRTNPSQKQKVPHVRLREQSVPVSGATLRSEHSPSDFYLIGAHGNRLSSPSGGLGDTISRPLVNSPPGPPSSTSTSGPAYKYTGPALS